MSTAKDQPGGARLALWLCAASVAISLALRALYLMQPWRVDWNEFPMILGDEGALGVMAMHVLRGSHPIFYYGGYYLGALDAYLAAAAFSLFGSSLLVQRAVPSALSIFPILLAYMIARHVYDRRAGLLAAALVAVPSRFVFEWSSKALPGFFTHVSLVLLVVYMVLLLMNRISLTRVAVLGLTAGLAIWNNLLALPYAVVGGVVLLLWTPLRRKQVTVLLVAGAIGMSPLIVGNVVHPLGTFRALGRKVLFAWGLGKERVADKAEQSDESAEYRSVSALQVLGAQPRNDGHWSVLGSLGAGLLLVGFFGAAWTSLLGRNVDRNDFRRHLLLLTLAVVSIGLGMGGFVGQPVGRYQLLLYPLLSIVAAGWLVRAVPRRAWAVVAFVVLGQTVVIAAPLPVHRTPQSAVVAALQRKDLHYGYAAGPMYDIVFNSGEKIVLVPLDHSRYPPYEAKVARADRIFYLYGSDQESKPAHRAFLNYLANAGIQYERMDVGDYHFLYGFEPRDGVTPRAIAQVRAGFRSHK